MYIGLHVNCPLVLSDLNKSRIFPTYLKKNSQISNFMKILPVEAELFHGDGKTDRQKRHDNTNTGFLQFCERA